jgi:hypothetical protein
MEYLIVVVGFAGGWLLFAGPLLQAWLELREETFDRDAMAALVADVPHPPRVSTWWWLLPPVAIYKSSTGQRAYQEAVSRALSDDQRAQMLSFSNKANAWFVVAGGAYLIAVKETWEAVEKFELWPGLFWILIVLMPVLCVVALALRAMRTQQALGTPKPPARPRPGRAPAAS